MDFYVHDWEPKQNGPKPENKKKRTDFLDLRKKLLVA